MSVSSSLQRPAFIDFSDFAPLERSHSTTQDHGHINRQLKCMRRHLQVPGPSVKWCCMSLHCTYFSQAAVALNCFSGSVFLHTCPHACKGLIITSLLHCTCVLQVAVAAKLLLGRRLPGSWPRAPAATLRRGTAALRAHCWGLPALPGAHHAGIHAGTVCGASAV
jgi:hypothetical protein